METQQLLEAAQTIKAINSLFADKPNEWLPVIAAIGGAFVGGISTFFATYFLEARKHRKEKRAITTALLSEISALLVIIEHRNYVSAFKKVTDYLRVNPDEAFKYTIRIPQHYSRIYQAHVDRIGFVEPKLAAKIIEFHQLVDSIIQDVTPGGPIHDEGGNLEAFEELIKISEAAISIGKELSVLHV
ncbi:MAG: hypothetical protein Q8K57_12445 [Thiobacillus sp.]|nr:hypothetical protein [Thiobacillus sp.]